MQEKSSGCNYAIRKKLPWDKYSAYKCWTQSECVNKYIYRIIVFTNELKKKVIARHIRAYTTVLAKRKAPAAVNIAPLYKIHDVMKYKAIIPNATRKHPLAIW